MRNRTTYELTTGTPVTRCSAVALLSRKPYRMREGARNGGSGWIAVTESSPVSGALDLTATNSMVGADSRSTQYVRSLGVLVPELQPTFLAGLCEDALDARRLTALRGYADDNYSGEFRPENGLEEIFELIRRPTPPGVWGDLGAGPFTALWALCARAATEVVAVDICVEALWLADRKWAEFLDGEFVSSLVEAGMASAGDVSRVAGLPRRYVVCDLFDRSAIRPSGQATLCTAFGLLGLAEERDQLAAGVAAARQMLVPGGAFVGASWRRRARASALFEEWPAGFCAMARSTGFSVESLVFKELPCDGIFDAVATWRFAVANEELS